MQQVFTTILSSPSSTIDKCFLIDTMVLFIYLISGVKQSPPFPSTLTIALKHAEHTLKGITHCQCGTHTVNDACSAVHFVIVSIYLVSTFAYLVLCDSNGVSLLFAISPLFHIEHEQQ